MLSFRSIAPFLLAIAFPLAALADLNQTSVLSSGSSINFDTGELNPSGAKDIVWNGTTITLQSTVLAYRLYDDFDEQFFTTVSSFTLQGIISLYTANPSTPAVGGLYGLRTDANHFVRLYIKAISAGSITIRFTTFGVPQGGGGGNNGPPVIEFVLNNSSNIPDGLPNSGISPSSIFVVKGSGLADPGVPTLQNTEIGLPRTLNGAVITVKVGSFTQDVPIYYTSPTQLAGVLPAATPLGNGTMTVTYKGVASNAFAIKVIAAAPGVTVYNGNTGVVQDAITYQLITITNPTEPGKYITIWANGLGADPADPDDHYTGTPHEVSTSIQVYIGGKLANLTYRGASVYPGVSVLVAIVPDNVPEGCWASLSIVANGVVSNSGSIPIRRGGGACVDTVTGLSTAQLTAGTGGTYRAGVLSLVQTNDTDNGVTTTFNAANAAFHTYTGVFTPSNQVSPGSCIVNDTTLVSSANATGLTPGAITITGPNSLSAPLAQPLGAPAGSYNALLSATAIPNSGGAFTFTATQGPDIGPFSTPVNLTGPIFAWTNTAAVATVNRQQGFTVTWTGGNTGSWVFITGNAVTQSTTVGAGFTCLAPVSAGTFTVPPYILLALPAGNGGINLQNYAYSSLTATGLDITLVFSDISHSVDTVVQ